MFSIFFMRWISLIFWQIYHRLDRGNNKLANRTLSSGSTTQNMKGDTEVLSETNEQKKDNVHVGYENNSNKVQPNSSTDLNLSGMNNSDSSEWNSLMQYKSTAWKVSKYGVISGPYFYCIRTRNNCVFGHFSHSEVLIEKNSCTNKRMRKFNKEGTGARCEFLLFFKVDNIGARVLSLWRL